MIHSSVPLDRYAGDPLGQKNSEPDEVIHWMESCLASMMTIRYADLIMIRDPSIWSVLPLVVLVNNIYNDPRKPVSVEPGLRVFGNPDPVTSPGPDHLQLRPDLLHGAL